MQRSRIPDRLKALCISSEDEEVDQRGRDAHEEEDDDDAN
jgi:hypothetical protein